MKLGSLFSGYEGLTMGVQRVLGGDLAWVSDIDPGACKILAHRFPDVPNLGDITRIDWVAVEPVDVLTGGSPCQDLSHAGKRGGMTTGTRSNLWVEMREAIAVLRPGLVVWENVRGAYSAAADSAMEPCPGCVGDDPTVFLRALGRVLGDLSDLGYDAVWNGLRAADVGAPHGRFRVFVIAWPIAYTEDNRRPRLVTRRPEPQQSWSAGAAGDAVLLKTPTAQLAVNGGSQHPNKRRAGGHGPTLADQVEFQLLPTPRATDGTKGGPNQRGSSGDLMLPSAVQQLLPTPSAADGNGGGRRGSEGHQMPLPGAVLSVDWGTFEPAVRQWETLTRPAPAPTGTGPRGGQRLSPRFVEWMMGLPDGWVTDPVIGLTRNEQLKALGNGVVPQQAEAALRYALSIAAVTA